MLGKHDSEGKTVVALSVNAPVMLASIASIAGRVVIPNQIHVHTRYTYQTIINETLTGLLVVYLARAEITKLRVFSKRHRTITGRMLRHERLSP